ncbi:hypothetical protein DIPPA_32985 [Diplonema papillatum]|nr:hypothetical protein DIPPA_32985 [Diplonema papillatum]
MTDRSKGLTETLVEEVFEGAAPRFAKCLRHLAKNIMESMAGSKDSISDVLFRLAAARTDSQYQEVREVLRKEYGKPFVGKVVKKCHGVTWADKQLVSPRLGEYTSNAVESLNGKLLEARALGICCFFREWRRISAEWWTTRAHELEGKEGMFVMSVTNAVLRTMKASGKLEKSPEGWTRRRSVQRCHPAPRR